MNPGLIILWMLSSALCFWFFIYTETKTRNVTLDKLIAIIIISLIPFFNLFVCIGMILDDLSKNSDFWDKIIFKKKEQIVMAKVTPLSKQEEDILRDILAKIFNVNYEECFISDESILGDFSMCCLPEDSSTDPLSYDECLNIADKIMIEKFKQIFGIEIEATDTFRDVIRKYIK